MAEIPESERTTQALIDKYIESQKERPRPHLGASLLGHPCDRWLWLSFRWAVIEKFSGRMLRLFRRGKREEETIVQDLRNAGIVIHSTCLDEGGQDAVNFGCHVAGSIDGIIESGVPEAPATRHIAEFKTHSLKSFAKLKAEGVRKAKLQHWCQMQVYMMGKKIDRALYLAVCKDNDEIYTERVIFDPRAAKALVDRGRRLALTERLPEPLSSNPSWWECAYCPAHDFCHVSHKIKEVNCRTCCHVTPIADGTWTCALTRKELSYEEQLEGCARHVVHPDLVPWPWKGASQDGRAAKFEINGQEVLIGEGDANVYSSKEILGVAGPVEKVEEMELPF